MISHFYCDTKYDNVIVELTKRGWVPLTESEVLPLSCQLIWNNMNKIVWPAVINRYVNHIRGSHHMSNKVNCQI